MVSDRKSIALSYIVKGWPVLPLHTPYKDGSCNCDRDCSSPGKHPRVQGGVKSASKDPKIILGWWNKWPDANIGIATGKPSGLLVVDLDDRHDGIKSWKTWIKEHPITSSLIAKTGGGYHLYFRAPQHEVSCRTNILPGVDIRADGGYITAPGSLHHSGTLYTWVKEDASALELTPQVLLDLIETPKNKSQIKVTPKDETSKAHLGRNDFLTRVGGFFRREGLDVPTLEKSLKALNIQVFNPPLPESEINSISQSLGKYETLWGEIQPIQDQSITVPSFDLNSLPSVIRHWVEDASERMQAPADFFAAPCIVSLAAMIGRQVRVFPRKEDNWSVTPNLWGAIIARPGLFKSPAIHEATSFMRNIAETASRNYQAERIHQRSQNEMLKAKIEGIKEAIKKTVKDQKNDSEFNSLKEQFISLNKELESHQIFEPRYIINDSTVEKLGVILQENPNGILLLRDELSGWAISLAKREGDREFYLESWNGNSSFTVDRIMRGTNFIPSLCVSIFGGIQPSKLEILSGNKFSGTDGLLQRFQILVYPEVQKSWKLLDRKPKEAEFNALQDVFQAISNLELYLEKTGDLRFSSEAQEIFNEWLFELEHRLRSGVIESEDFESHLAKYRSLLPSLALIFEVVTQISQNQKINSISKQSLELGICWVKYLELHALKVYQDDLCVAQNSAMALGKKILEGVVRDGDTLRSIYRHNWTGLNSPELVQKALERLDICSWATIEGFKNGSGQGSVIRINPQVYSFKKI